MQKWSGGKNVSHYAGQEAERGDRSWRETRPIPPGTHFLQPGLPIVHTTMKASVGYSTEEYSASMIQPPPLTFTAEHMRLLGNIAHLNPNHSSYSKFCQRYLGSVISESNSACFVSVECIFTVFLYPLLFLLKAIHEVLSN